jgi:hypothetical protein
VGEAVLLVPAIREAAPSEEESQAGPTSLVSHASGTHAAAVDLMGLAVVKAMADEVGVEANTAGRNGEHETAMAMRGIASSEEYTTDRRDNDCI